MSPRTGRPTKGPTKKTLSLQIRMTESEMNLLDECAKRTSGTRTDVVNEGVQLVKERLDAQKSE